MQRKGNFQSMICEGGGTDGTQPQRPANTPTCDKTPPRVTNPSPPGGPPPAAPKQRKLGLHVPPPTSPTPPRTHRETSRQPPGSGTPTGPAGPPRRTALKAAVSAGPGLEQPGQRGGAGPPCRPRCCQRGQLAVRRPPPRCQRTSAPPGCHGAPAPPAHGPAPPTGGLRRRRSRDPLPPPPQAAPRRPPPSAQREPKAAGCGAGRRGAGRPSRRLPAPLPSPRAPGLRRSPVPARRPLPLALPPSRSSPCQRQHGRDRGRAPPRRILPAARGDGARAGPGPSGRRFGPAPTEAAKPKWRRLLLHRERAPGAPPPRARPRPLRRPHPLTVAPPPSRQPEGRGGRREKRPELSGWVGPRSRCAFCPFPAAVAPRSARSRGDPVSAARCGGCRR